MRRAVFPIVVLALWSAFFAFLGGAQSFAYGLSAYLSGFALVAGLPLGLRLAWGVLTGNSPSGWGKFFLRAWRFHSFLAVAFAALCALPAWYHLSVAPAELPVVTLTDGKKTVVFRSMSHVGTKGFYGRVQKEVAAAKAAGAAYLYEGIRAGKPGSMERLQAVLGVKVGADAYEALGRVAGLESQASYVFTGFGTGADRNADLDADAVLAAYAGAAGTGAEAAAGTGSAEPFDPEAWARDVLAGIPPRGRALVAALARSALSSMAKSEDSAALALGGEGGPGTAAILGARDAYAARAIADAPEKNLYVTYGALHFKGVYAALRAIDPVWDIVSVRPDRPFSE